MGVYHLRRVSAERLSSNRLKLSDIPKLHPLSGITSYFFLSTAIARVGLDGVQREFV